MSAFRVLLTDLPWGNYDIERAGLAAAGAEIVIAPDGSEATLIRLAAGVDAIATCWARVTATVLDAAPTCRIVARLGIGLDNIDVRAATEKRIVVTNVPDYCVSEVADHTLALLLAMARNVGFFHLADEARASTICRPVRRCIACRRRRWASWGWAGSAAPWPCVPVRFGMNVLAHTRSGDDHGVGCPMVDLPTLLAASDYVSLHVPATAETRHLINAETLRHMRPGGATDQHQPRRADRSGRTVGRPAAGAGLRAARSMCSSRNRPTFRIRCTGTSG